MSGIELSLRANIAIQAGFSETIPTTLDQLRNWQSELRSGLVGNCPAEKLREWLTVSLILGEVLVASQTGDLNIPWLSNDIKFKLLPEKDLLYMASYRWDECELKNGIAIASNTIAYAKAVLEKRDHVWFDILSHFDGMGARAIVLAKMGGWYCDRIVIPVDYMVLDPNIAFERTRSRAWIYQEQCIPALDVEILPSACYIHLAYVRGCLKVETQDWEDSGDGLLEPTSSFPVEIRRYLRARFYRKDGSYMITVQHLRQQAELSEALPGAVKRFEEGTITFEKDRPIACFSVIFKLAGIENNDYSEESLSAGINLACLQIKDSLLFSGGRRGVCNVGLCSNTSGACALPPDIIAASNDRWMRAWLACGICFWGIFIAVAVLALLLTVVVPVLFLPSLLLDLCMGNYRAKFSTVAYKIGISDVLSLVSLPAAWLLLLLARLTLYLMFKGQIGARTLRDEFFDALRLRYTLMRYVYRLWGMNIEAKIWERWDLVMWHNLGECRLTARHVIVSHWSAKLMLLDRHVWEEQVQTLARERALGC
jgi:hypothetical protein